MTRKIQVLVLFFFAVKVIACGWALQSEAPVYQGEHIPLRVGVSLVDNVGNKYGEKVIESLRAWGVFDEIVYPYRGGGEVDATLRLTLDALDRSGAVVASNLLLGLGTLGIAGQGTDAKHRITADLQIVGGQYKRYVAEVDSYFHRSVGMRKEQIAQRTRYLQTSKLAHAIAIQLEKDRAVLAQAPR